MHCSCHGLAVRRKAAGLGIGSAPLTFAVDRAASAGTPCVRLDWNKNNERLQASHLEEGFTYLRTRCSAVRTADDSDDRFIVDLKVRKSS